MSGLAHDVATGHTPAMLDPAGGQRPVRVTLVGPGFFLLGGLSVYTCRLANGLAEQGLRTSVLLLKKVIPARFYPGAARAGQQLSNLSYAPGVRMLGEVDWFWGAQLLRSVIRLRKERPDLLVLQWWTAATLHTYLALAIVARLLRIPVALEFHETQDTGEAKIPLVAPYCKAVMPLLLRLTSASLVHNAHDSNLLRTTYGARSLDRMQIEVAPHGPYDHLGVPARGVESRADSDTLTRLLFFGLIRPYKGLEDLIAAFDGLTPEEAADFELTVVGETWEGWTTPAEKIGASPHRQRITFVNRYVSDEEASVHFADADAVVLPYRRGSASGPLQIAMSNGLHAVLYAVGGLVEAVDNYEGAVLVTPGDIDGLREALLNLRAVRRKRFTDPHSWAATALAMERMARDRTRPRPRIYSQGSRGPSLHDADHK